MFKEKPKKDDVDYENDFKIVIAGAKVNDDQLKVHQLKSLESFSRSSESLALTVTSIGDNTKSEKERRKKKTRSASRGKKEEREKVCDYGVSRDSGESFISGIMASVKKEGWNSLGDNEEERLRLMNMRLEGKLSVTKQAGDEMLRDHTKLTCELEAAKREIDDRTKRLLTLEEKDKLWNVEKDGLKEFNIDLEKRVSNLKFEIETKSDELEEVNKHLEMYKETIMLQEKNISTVKDDVEMKESIISDLKKKMCELNSQLELVKLYRENSDYQAEQSRLEVGKANNARKFVEEQLRAVEEIRDQLQAEVQRVRRNLDHVCGERDLLDQKTQSFELKLAKLQGARLHETTQLLFELEQLQKEIIVNGNDKDAIEERYETLCIVYEEKIRDIAEERKRIDNLQKQYDELSQELDDTKEQMNRSVADLDLLETEASELRKRVAVFESTLAQKSIEIGMLEAENAALKESLLEWRNASEHREERISVLDEELTNVRNSLDRVCQERDQSKMFIEGLRDDCEKVTEQFEMSRQNLCSKDEALRLMEEMNDEMRAQLLGESEKIAARNSMIEHLHTEKANVIENYILLESNHRNVCSELEKLRRSLSEAMATMATMEDELRATTNENRRLCDNRDATETEMMKVRLDLEAAHRRLEELNEVQTEYGELLERNRRIEADYRTLSDEHRTLAIDFQRKTEFLEQKLQEREEELERVVTQSEEVVQVSGREVQALQRARADLTENLENVKFNQAIELAKKEEQFREQLEKSEKEYSQMCQEKIRCESAIEKLQKYINDLVDDYNKRLNECKTKMLTMEKKSNAYEEYENKSRALLEELERRKGEIEGVLEEWKKMKDYASILETALARHKANIDDIVSKNNEDVECKNATIKELNRKVIEEQDKWKLECSRNGTMRSQMEEQSSALNSVNRKLRNYEDSYGSVVNDLEERKRAEELLVEENRLLRETHEQMAKELERKSKENRELMQSNQSLAEQIELAINLEKRGNESLVALQHESAQKSQRILDTNKKREKLVQRFKDEKKEMKFVIKDVQHEKESLTRTAELSQQNDIITSSVLSHLRSEVERILFKEKIYSENSDPSVRLSEENLKQLQQLLKETEAPIKATKPLSRLSKCIEDLRSQVDTMQEEVLEQFKGDSISESNN